MAGHNVRRLATVVAVLSAAVLSACGGSGPASGPATTSGTTTGTASGSGGTSQTVAQITKSTGDLETYYEGLPHTSLSSDLTALASYMVSSGDFSEADVTEGGISAILPDGSPFAVFADRLTYDYPSTGGTSTASDKLTVAKSSAPSSAPDSSAPSSAPTTTPTTTAISWPLSPANAHEIAFLVNMSDAGAFNPPVQQALAQAWKDTGATEPDYGVDFMDVTLDNILALSSDHPIDLLDISTHGTYIYLGPHLTLPHYAWLSTTPVSDANNTKYADDIAANRVRAAARLGSKIPIYYMTPEFVTGHLTFNSGAVVDNESCFGQYSSTTVNIAAGVQAAFQAANVGQYLGWTGLVGAVDADQSEAFLFSRLLGSDLTSSLAAFVNFPNKSQRPFPLTDVLAAMAQEVRNPVLDPYNPSNNYAQSAAPTPPYAEPVSLVVSSFMSVSPGTGLLINGLPSISYVDIVETATGGVLTLHGYFPGTVSLVGVGVESDNFTKLTPTSVTPTTVTATLPLSASHSSGMVGTSSTDGIPSNLVPLTQWSATLQFNTQGGLSGFTGTPGTGTGTFSATLNINFRADVHQVITAVDTSPQQQNFVFQGVMANSTAALTSVGGSFSSAPGVLSGGDETVLFSMMQPPPTLSWGSSTPVSAGQFVLAPLTGQPASCNNAMIGVQPGPATVFCPVAEFLAADAVACTNTSSNNPVLCASGAPFGNALYNQFGSTLPGDGLLVFTLNPADYSISLTSTPAALTINVANGIFGGSSIQATGTVTGTVSAPSSPPAASN